ncbi:hypothetical protein ACIBP6_19525 [Nonomuraea terrae]|uniref:MmyB family transcriptional regulator n=1 Tax=Nonomuraea terrae TaxID=2530383 RepID=UPI0037AE2925
MHLDFLGTACRPAFVLGRRLDVLAHNRLAGRLITDFRALPAAERNQARFVFLDPHARELYANWPRSPPTRPPCSAATPAATPMIPLVGDLSIHGDEFRRYWADNKVHQRATGSKDYHHPLLGDVAITYQALTPADDSDQTLFVYDAEPGSPSETALHLPAQ